MNAGRFVSVMVGAALLLPFGVSAATDWETLNARSRTGSSV